MVYETFLETVTSQLQEALGDSYQFMLRPLPKNNGVTLDGLTIQSPDCSVAPTIYLNPYYEQYQRGTDIHEIVHDTSLPRYSDSIVSPDRCSGPFLQAPLPDHVPAHSHRIQSGALKGSASSSLS